MVVVEEEEEENTVQKINLMEDVDLVEVDIVAGAGLVEHVDTQEENAIMKVQKPVKGEHQRQRRSFTLNIVDAGHQVRFSKISSGKFTNLMKEKLKEQENSGQQGLTA